MSDMGEEAQAPRMFTLAPRFADRVLANVLRQIARCAAKSASQPKRSRVRPINPGADGAVRAPQAGQ
ncbi:hypothetical protein T281_11740 [Rhodomicrobium udaipurense JA643]|nr:hypothetical protein T281_11740 [Rhodomicrobium udaipurense JA643]